MAKIRRSLKLQIQELNADTAGRENGLFKSFCRGYYRDSEVDYGIENVRSAVGSLEWLQKNEKLIRQRCPELFGGDA